MVYVFRLEKLEAENPHCLAEFWAKWRNNKDIWEFGEVARMLPSKHGFRTCRFGIIFSSNVNTIMPGTNKSLKHASWNEISKFCPMVILRKLVKRVSIKEEDGTLVRDFGTFELHKWLSFRNVRTENKVYETLHSESSIARSRFQKYWIQNYRS